MARRSGSSGPSGSGIGPMNTIIAGFVGLLVIVAIVILGPVLAGSIQQSTDNINYGEICRTNTSTALGYTEQRCTGDPNENVTQWSDWNATHNTDMPTGTSIWSTSVVIGGVVLLVFFISLAIYYIRVIA